MNACFYQNIQLTKSEDLLVFSVRCHHTVNKLLTSYIIFWHMTHAPLLGLSGITKRAGPSPFICKVLSVALLSTQPFIYLYTPMWSAVVLLRREALKGPINLH